MGLLTIQGAFGVCDADRVALATGARRRLERASVARESARAFTARSSWRFVMHLLVVPVVIVDTNELLVEPVSLASKASMYVAACG